MTVYLLRNPTKPAATTVCLQAAEILLSVGAHVILPPELRPLCSLEGVEYEMPHEALCKAEVVVAVGGDGTILHTAKECLPYDKPILGINLGRTGFLSTCEVDEMPLKLSMLSKGQFQLDNRALLKATIDGNSANAKIALNDIVVFKGHRVQAIDYDIYCDNIQVDHCRGDGVIVSTPTGSTAYSMSAGGPILDAHIRGLVVTPICAHALQNPAIVFAEDRKITIQANSSDRNKIFIASDGGQEELLRDGGYVQVELSDKNVKLITFNPADQFDAIGNKLRRR